MQLVAGVLNAVVGVVDTVAGVFGAAAEVRGNIEMLRFQELLILGFKP